MVIIVGVLLESSQEIPEERCAVVQFGAKVQSLVRLRVLFPEPRSHAEESNAVLVRFYCLRGYSRSRQGMPDGARALARDSEFNLDTCYDGGLRATRRGVADGQHRARRKSEMAAVLDVICGHI